MTDGDDAPPIAVTVIGGYLGAGKTTLVNRILQHADERVALIVNDFGDINIDADLIERQDEQMLSLTNGCICCSLVDGLAGALTTILGLAPRPERLVIEASGVADPAQVAAYGHAPGLLPDAVVVLADAETIRRRASDRYVGDTVARQLDAADIIVFTKIDLVEDDELSATRDWVAQRWPRAVVLEAEHGRVPPSVLFGAVPTRAPRTGTSPHDHAAEQVFHAWTLLFETPMSRPSIERLMADLPTSIVRAKGIVWLDDAPDRQTILQRVGERWSLSPGGPWREDPASRLVFVGTDPSAGDVLRAHHGVVERM